MNVRNNIRRRKSREAIEKVFLDLLEEKDINQITVSEICKKANLNRSTFYSNYLDIYDLADTIFSALQKSLSEKFDHDIMLIDTFDHITEFFDFVKENQKLFKHFFKLGYAEKIETREYNKQLAEEIFASKHMDYHIEFFKYGFSAVLKKWIYGGCVETAEEMTEILRSEYRGR